MKSQSLFTIGLCSVWRYVSSIVLSIFIFTQSAAADTECWVGEVFASGVSAIGPYPDRASILYAAQQKVEDEVLGVPIQCSSMPPSPIVGVELWCPWRSCIVNLGMHGGAYETDDCGGDICIPWIADFRFLLLLQDGTRCAGYNYGISARNAARDAKPPALCAATYTVRLSPASSAAESETVLKSIEPDKPANLIARVYDQNNQLVPNVDVQLTLEAKQDSGGHHHGDNTVAARTGTLAGQQVLIGNTGPSGLLFSYKAPSVSGDIAINASCTGGKSCTQQGAKQVWVGVKDLVLLSSSDAYVLLPNQDTGHPNNHYLTSTARSKISGLAVAYKKQFPNNPLLHLNDSSLERGGVLDFKHNWDQPHKTHRRGQDTDIRANEMYHDIGAIPVLDYFDFIDLAAAGGCTASPHNLGEPSEHFHVSCY
jgi:hypothetical protein